VIHFNLDSSKSYAGVQEQLLNQIKKHLLEGSWSEAPDYRKGALNFSVFIGRKSEVLMSHGAADKNYHFRGSQPGSSHPKMNHAMDRKHILVPGDWLKNRIVSSASLEFTDSQVHAMGWPRLDLLFAQMDAKPKRPEGLKKKLLWAPTHDLGRRGPKALSLSSYPEFEPYLEKLAERYEIMVSLHPRNRKNKAPTKDALIEADVVIPDFGTTVYEAVALGKQVIFPSWIVGDAIRDNLKFSAEHAIYSNNYGLHATSIDHLVEMIETDAGMDQRSIDFFDSYNNPLSYRRSGKIIADFLIQTAKDYAG
jgi:hypothetical protein